jgi:predicted nicotinamide N-methyase
MSGMSEEAQQSAERPAVTYSAAVAGQLPVQGELIPVEEIDDGFWRAEDAAGRYTARRFFLKRPDDYRRVIELLAAGAGLLKIAALLKVHHRTVAAVRDIEGEQIDISKQRIRRNFRLGLEIAAERLPEIMKDLPAGQVPVAAAILADKLVQMDGEPTQRVEVTLKGKLTHEAVAASIAQFPDAEDADFTATDSGAGESGQKALPAPTPEPAVPTPLKTGNI